MQLTYYVGSFCHLYGLNFTHAIAKAMQRHVRKPYIGSAQIHLPTNKQILRNEYQILYRSHGRDTPML